MSEDKNVGLGCAFNRPRDKICWPLRKSPTGKWHGQGHYFHEQKSCTKYLIVFQNIVPFLVTRIADRVTNSDTSGTLPDFATNLVNYAPASLLLSKPV